MKLKVILRGLDKGNQAQACLESLYATDHRLNPWKRILSIEPLCASSDDIAYTDKQSKIMQLTLQTPEYPYFLHARIDLPQYGNIWVMAKMPERQDEKSFTLNTDSDSPAYDFLELAWQTYIDLYNGYHAYVVSDSESTVETVANYRQAMDSYVLYQREQDEENKTYLLLLGLSHAIRAAEDALYEKSSKQVQLNKRGDVLIGCNTLQFSEDSVWRNRFSAVFNYATLPFYAGRIIESIDSDKPYPEAIKLNFNELEQMQSWCERHAIATKGHPLFFGHQETNPHVLQTLSWDQLKAVFVYLTQACVTRFKGRVKYWDVINEAHDWANTFSLSQEKNIEMADLLCRTVRACDPEAKLVINSSLVFGEYVANNEVCYGPIFPKLKSPMDYLDDIIAAGVDFDIIGLQLYFPARDLAAIQHIVEVYAQYGKSVHITELGVPSGSGRGEDYTMARRDINPQIGLTRGQWRAAWSEEIQAKWLERFYVQMLSIPEVSAISWWDMQDSGFMKTSPFLLKNGDPRAHYYRLSALKDKYLND